MDKTDINVRYEKLKEIVKERKEQFDELIAFMENETMVNIPASTKYHLCEKAGF